MSDPRDALAERIALLIDRLGEGGRDDEARDRLLDELVRHQLARIVPWDRLARARGVHAEAGPRADDVPALPTDVFRHARVAVHPAQDDVRVFHTSGTSGRERGVHPLRDLGLYDRAARHASRYALFPDRDRLVLVILAPPEREAPHSSLSYMLARFAEWYGREGARWVWRDEQIDVAALEGALSDAQAAGTPVALLGTSFAFVHAEDALAAAQARFELPSGSRIMHTGGFKGRSREVDPVHLRELLTTRYGVPASHVVLEYGMTELSSQMYDLGVREASEGRPPRPGRLWVPGWMRATPVHPETLAPVAEGEVGILRVDDLANVDTPCSIQTSDRARREDDRVVVLGRARGAAPRGCSLAVDEALGGRP